MTAAQRLTAGRVALFFGDALFGFALFMLMACLVAGDGRAQGPTASDAMAQTQFVVPTSTLALLGEPAMTGTPTPVSALSFEPERTSIGLRQTDADTARILLAIVFSGLVALNLGFFRHLRRTYVLAH